VDVEHPFALIDAVDRTLLDTGEILQIDARLRDGVGHENVLLSVPARGVAGTCFLVSPCMLGHVQPRASLGAVRAGVAL
jgi:hypothetical protein